MSEGNGAHGNGARGSASPARGEERGRSRSRPRGEEVPEANAVEEPHQEGKENEGEVPGTPGTVAKKMATRHDLMVKIVGCTQKLASASEDVTLAIEEMKESKLKLAEGFQLLAAKMEDTCHAVTTMGATVTAQSAEISRMLKAFDKNAAIVKWALKTNVPLEEAIGGVSTSLGSKLEKIEGRVGLAFENVSRGIIQLVEAIQSPQGPSVLQPGQYPPAFPIEVQGQGTGSQNIPPPPGDFQGKGGQPAQSMKGAPSGQAMGSGGQKLPVASSGQNAPRAVGAIPMAPPSFMATPMTPAGQMEGQQEEAMLSTFISFLPMNSGEQLPSISQHPGVATPRKGAALITYDSKTRGRRELSPTGYSHQQLYALTSSWCPGGVASPHNGKNELHRIYI